MEHNEESPTLIERLGEAIRKSGALSVRGVVIILATIGAINVGHQASSAHFTLSFEKHGEHVKLGVNLSHAQADEPERQANPGEVQFLLHRADPYTHEPSEEHSKDLLRNHPYRREEWPDTEKPTLDTFIYN